MFQPYFPRQSTLQSTSLLSETAINLLLPESSYVLTCTTSLPSPISPPSTCFGNFWFILLLINSLIVYVEILTGTQKDTGNWASA